MSKPRGFRNVRMSGMCSALLALTFAMTACMVPPIPLAKRTKSIAGVDLQVDVKAIKPGMSTREQVQSMLSSIVVEESADRCWARYVESRSSNPGGYRAWGAKNVFVTFDSRGIVDSVRSVGDHELIRELRGWESADPKLAKGETRTLLEAPVLILRPWVSHKAKLTIDADGIQVVDHDVSPEYSVNLPTASVKRISAEATFEEIPRNVFLKISIDGVEGERRTLQAELTPQQLREWIRFLQKNYPSAEYR